MSIATRLDRLERLPTPPRRAWSQPFNPRLLSDDERGELRDLLRRRQEAGSFSVFTDAEFDRMATLVFRAHGERFVTY